MSHPVNAARVSPITANAHALAFDHYGNRAATSDGATLKIWHNDVGGQWAEGPIHEWPLLNVQSLAWSHPLFGSLLAAAARDQSVSIWQGSTLDGAGSETWAQVSALKDQGWGVMDVAFAPSQFGLRVATACGDGVVRVHEAVEQDLHKWEVAEQFEAQPQDPQQVTSLSWNPNELDPVPSLVVGCADGAVSLWSCIDQQWVLSCELKRHEGEVRSVTWRNSLGSGLHFVASGSAQVLYLLGGAGFRPLNLDFHLFVDFCRGCNAVLG